jgi:Mn-dependent DtxR family transcriptional regulator
MKRHLGKTQTAILNVLREVQDEYAAVTITSMSERLGVSQRQVRAAASSLAGRGLVVVTPPQETMVGLPAR